MGHIDQVLTANTVDQRFSPPIRAALTMGKKTLARYYIKTDMSDVYRIAMGTLFSPPIKHKLILRTLPSSSSLPQAQILQECGMVRKAV